MRLGSAWCVSRTIWMQIGGTTYFFDETAVKSKADLLLPFKFLSSKMNFFVYTAKEIVFFDIKNQLVF